MFRLFLHELKSRRTAILGWGIGAAAFGMLYMMLYPSVSEQISDFAEILELPIYQVMGVSDMVSFEGYAASTFLNFMPLIVSIYALMTGTGALAGEEDKGTLENLASLPLARWVIVLAKALAMIAAAFLIILIAAVGGLISLAYVQSQVQVDISYLDMLLVTYSTWPIITLFMMSSLFFGAFFPTRATAGMAATLFLLISYFGNNMFNLLEQLQDWRVLFPFYYYNSSAEVFSKGVELTDVLILLGTALAFLLLAIWAFQRRNLMIHAWFWQRSRVPE